MNIVEQIHAEFEGAQEKLIAHAPIAAAEALWGLGFINSKSVEEYSPDHESLRKAAEGYRMAYPNYRFITEKQVEKICAKYGLVLAPVNRFKGEVPTSKVAAMTAFQVKLGHVVERRIEWSDSRVYVDNRPYLDADNKLTSERWWDGAFDRLSRSRSEDPRKVYDPNTKNAAIGLWICAPEADIHMDGLTKVGHTVGEAVRVDDPVVLQPVHYGFLIVTAWGEEAADEDVIHPNAN